MKIRHIQISHHQLELDPAFPASWDSRPRKKFPATIVRVFDDEGRMGIGSGDPLYGFSDYAHLFMDQDPRHIERHSAVLANIDFHAGRPWPFEIALWDLLGKIEEKPLWQLLGGASQKVRAYASSGVRRSLTETADYAERAVALGYPAMKLRFGRADLQEDIAALAAIRQRVGDKLELMVDCNQAWRMPWDIEKAWDLAKALELAQELEKLNVYWMEEPLHRADYKGLQALRGQTRVKIAGGELTREIYEFQQLLEHDCFDVYQPDIAFTLGIYQARELAYRVKEKGHIFSPHTWGNGIGLMANLQLTAATTGTTFIEFPFDPPEWSTARRDFMLQESIEIDTEGWIVLSDKAGLGLELNEDLLEQTQSSSSSYG